MEKIVFAGSFDPITNGHFWVMKEALNLSQKLLVFIADNHNKKYMFSAQERKNHIETLLKNNELSDRCEVLIVKQEYVAQKAIQMGANYMIRGIRGTQDFDHEFILQESNTNILQGAKTLFVMPPKELNNVSSSFIKSWMGPIGWHNHIKQFLPENVYQSFLENFIKNEFSRRNIKDYKINEFLNFCFNQYKDKNRFYHNIEHICHCIQELIWLEANHPEVLSEANIEQLLVAILAHDVIYAAHQTKTDEQLSSEVVLDMLGEYYTKAANLVLVTQHLSEERKLNLTEIEKIMISIDLSILGQPPSTYLKYTTNIGLEYKHFPYDVYYNGRIQAMSKILKNTNIFPSKYFEHYETLAKNNIQKEINSIEELMVELSSNL